MSPFTPNVKSLHALALNVKSRTSASTEMRRLPEDFKPVCKDKARKADITRTSMSSFIVNCRNTLTLTHIPRLLPRISCASLLLQSSKDVLCMRGKVAFEHNNFFREMVGDHIEKYNNAGTKIQKSLVVSAIVDAIRDGSPAGGGFVRCIGGVYYELGDSVAREKVGGTFRDMLAHKYRSSAKAKGRRRLENKEARKAEEVVSGATFADSFFASPVPTKRRRVDPDPIPPSCFEVVPCQTRSIMSMPVPKDLFIPVADISLDGCLREEEYDNKADPEVPLFALEGEFSQPQTDIYFRIEEEPFELLDDIELENELYNVL